MAIDMKNCIWSCLFLCIHYSCSIATKKAEKKVVETPLKNTGHTAIIVENKIENLADSFDFPVGKPDAKGYYNAQSFGKNNHLGDDWNGIHGGNSDLGDPIYAIANGYVKFADDIGGGWGNVIRILHTLPNGNQLESVYAHCDSIAIKSNSYIEKGKQIGTIGTAHGQYLAHLHLEIRDDVNMGIGGGYAENSTGYVDPTKFIYENRKVQD